MWLAQNTDINNCERLWKHLRTAYKMVYFVYFTFPSHYIYKLGYWTRFGTNWYKRSAHKLPHSLEVGSCVCVFMGTFCAHCVWIFYIYLQTISIYWMAENMRLRYLCVGLRLWWSPPILLPSPVTGLGSSIGFYKQNKPSCKLVSILNCINYVKIGEQMKTALSNRLLRGSFWME